MTKASFYINGYLQQISKVDNKYAPVTFSGEIIFDPFAENHTGEFVDTQASKAKIQKFVFSDSTCTLSVRYLLSRLEYNFTFHKVTDDTWEGTFESPNFGGSGIVVCSLVSIPKKILPALITKHSDQHALRQYAISA